MRNKSKVRPTTNILQRRQCTFYEPEFKKIVALYAEQNGTVKAKCKYSVSESNIRRWRRTIRNSDVGNVLESEKAESVVPINPTKSKGRKDLKNAAWTTKSIPFSALDSMPLQQRLQGQTPSTSEQEPVLQSQPLSPTKLKVTRHSKPAQAAPPTQPPIEEVCLKWNSHHSNMQNSFPSLLLKEQYVDATLVAEGQSMKCHRVILSSCSSYFEEVMSSISPYQHPVLFMKDTPFWILKSLCDYMYAGEVHIPQGKLQELLAAAKSLKIKGLSEQPGNDNRAMKLEPQESMKEERSDDDEVRRRDETKRRDDRKKEDTKKKDEREMRRKDEVKKRDEVREWREKKRNLVTPPPEMPVLKSAKLSKVTQHNEMPNLSKNSRGSRLGNSRRSSKRSEKVETITKEASSMFLDPLDLLEPVYEEITKEPASTPKETKTCPAKRSFPKKLKKRKMAEDRDESPQPVLSKRGTRSRPNRKVPKFYHSSYDNSTIVREPHTDQADPLMQIQEIKSEPLFYLDDNTIEIEDNTIEIEDNIVGFSEQEITIDEEIMGDYDSPIVNFTRSKSDPAMDENASTKNENTLKIVNVEDIRGGTSEEDPLHVQNVIENNENCLGFRISEVVTEKEEGKSTEMFKQLGFEITNVVSEKEEECSDPSFRISNVQSGVNEASMGNRNDCLGDKNENDDNNSENHENISEASTCVGFQISDVQSALSDETICAVVEKMQVDDAPTGNGNSANPTEIQTESLGESTMTQLTVDSSTNVKSPAELGVIVSTSPEIPANKSEVEPNNPAEMGPTVTNCDGTQEDLSNVSCLSYLRVAEFSQLNNSVGVENSVEHKPTETQETPDSTELAGIDNPEVLTTIKPALPESTETLEVLSDIKAAEPEISLKCIENTTKLDKECGENQTVTCPNETVEHTSDLPDLHVTNDTPISNDLETIVNDLTNIVGESRSGGEGEGEDSSAIAESLENLLNE